MIPLLMHRNGDRSVYQLHANDDRDNAGRNLSSYLKTTPSDDCYVVPRDARFRVLGLMGAFPSKFDSL